MLALSDAARTAIVDGTVTAEGRVDLWRAGILLRAGVPLDGANPGSISIDETAAVRQTVTLNFAEPDDDEPAPKLLPLLAGPLAPTGNEVVVYVDLTLPDGTVETLQLGVFGLRKPQVKDAGGGQVISVTGRDRSQRIVDAQLTVPVDIASGANLATAIHDLIDGGVAGLTYTGFDPAATPYTAGDRHYAVGDDRWQHAHEMADAAGKQLRVDNLGRVELRDVPDPDSQPDAWQYTEGEDAIVSEFDQSLDADQTYSHAIVIFQPTDGTSPPVRSDAYDDDPASPTYHLGPFGDRPVRLVTNYGSTQAQADAASAALLLRKRGLLEDVTLTSMAVWAHEDGDVVLAQRPALGMDARYVLSKFAVPLGAGTMQLAARSRRIM